MAVMQICEIMNGLWGKNKKGKLNAICHDRIRDCQRAYPTVSLKQPNISPFSYSP